MMTTITFYCGLALVHFSAALQLQSLLDPNLQIALLSPILNRNVGNQDFAPFSGPVVFTTEQSLCDIPAEQLFAIANGSIVMMERFPTQLWDLPTLSKNAECLEAAGALAGIAAYHNVKDPGFLVNLPVHSLASIPLVQISFEDVPNRIMDMLQTSQDLVLATIEASENPWEDLWDSTRFKVLWVFVFPGLNLLCATAAVLAIITLTLHWRHTTRAIRGNPLKRNTRDFNLTILIVGNVLMCCTSLFRVYYCLKGPMNSSTSLSATFQNLVVNLTVLAEAIASMIAIVVFRQWSNFGMISTKRNLSQFLAILGAVGVCGYVSASVVQVTHSSTLTDLLTCLVLIGLSGFVTLVYMLRVLQFARGLSFGVKLGVGKRQLAIRRRIATLMLMSGGMNLLTVISLSIMAFAPSFCFTISGQFMAHSLLFIGLTLQATTQVFAFFPSLNVLRNKGKVVHKPVLVTQPCASQNYQFPQFPWLVRRALRPRPPPPNQSTEEGISNSNQEWDSDDSNDDHVNSITLMASSTEVRRKVIAAGAQYRQRECTESIWTIAETRPPSIPNPCSTERRDDQRGN